MTMISLGTAKSRRAPDVNRQIAPNDAMFAGNKEHYFSVGESALRIVSAAASLAQLQPRSILDYGAGAGRVTRWLQVGFPDAQFHACDIRDVDMEFLTTFLGVRAWSVGKDIEALRFSATYDLIWVGSVITHLPAEQTRRLIEILLAATNSGGVLILSFHGRAALDPARVAGYFDPAREQTTERWQTVLSGLARCGYGYTDYAQTPGYGISVCTSSWMTDLVHSIRGARIVLIGEQLWDDNHDVVAIRKG